MAQPRNGNCTWIPWRRMGAKAPDLNHEKSWLNLLFYLTKIQACTPPCNLTSFVEQSNNNAGGDDGFKLMQWHSGESDPLRFLGSGQISLKRMKTSIQDNLFEILAFA
eukprot:5051554-Amphidinium_carterae.1